VVHLQIQEIWFKVDQTWPAILSGGTRLISASMMTACWSLMYHQLLTYSYTLIRIRKCFLPRASHNRSKPDSMNHKCWLPTYMKGRNYVQSVTANWEVVSLLPHIEVNNAQTTNKLRPLNKDRPTWCHLFYYFTVYCSTCFEC